MSLIDALLLEPPKVGSITAFQEVYLAVRSDGIAGSGTITDPFMECAGLRCDG